MRPARGQGFFVGAEGRAKMRSMLVSRRRVLAGLGFGGLAAPLGADWKAFLGPNHNGVVEASGLIKQFGEDTPQLLWEMPKGEGYSSPALADGKLVFAHREADEEVTVCLEPRTGKTLWRTVNKTAYRDRYGYNNGPRASPVIHERTVYTFGAQGTLTARSLATGEKLWRREINQQFGVKQDFFGTASTPLVEGDELIVQVGAPGGPTVVGLDLETGKTRWEADTEWGPSYASPTPATIHGERRVFCLMGGDSRPPKGGLVCLDPASGEIDFSFPWRSASYESVNASCPVVSGNRVLISATYKTGTALLEVDEKFEVKEVWQSAEFDMHFATPILKDGFYYGFAGRNEPDAGLVCVDAVSGETVWREVLEWKETATIGGREREFYAGPFRGSMLLVGEHFLTLGEQGHLLWLDLSPDGPQVLTKKRLFLARQSWSPPVLDDGLLFVCQNTRDFTGESGPRLLAYSMEG